MHELAHVVRGDGLTQLLASIALALYWFQPALWFAVVRLRREQELACDDRVLLAGAAPLDYAQALLDVATDRGGKRLLVAVSMAAPSQLGDRLKAIVVERPRSFGRRGGIAAIASAFAVLFLTALVESAPAATVDEVAAAAAPIASSAPRAVPVTESPAAIDAPLPPTPSAADEEAAPTETTRENENKSRHRHRSPLPELSPVPPPPELPELPEVTPPPAIPALPPIPAIPAVEPVPATPATPASHRKD